MFYLRTGVPVKLHCSSADHSWVATVLPEPASADDALTPRRYGHDDTFDRLAQLTAKALGSSAAFVSLTDPGVDEIIFTGLTGLPEIPTGHRVPLSGTICRYVVASGTPLAVDDTSAHPLARSEALLHELGIGAYLGVPLTSATGETVGVLCNVDRFTRPWTDAQIEIAEGLAAAVMTEIDLRSAEHRYRSLIENLPLVTYLNSVQEPVRTVFMSPQIVGLLGYTAEEWLAHPELVTGGIHPDDRDRVRELTTRLRADCEPGRCEFRFITRDGREVWVLDQTTPVRDADGETVGFQGFLLDITEHKRLEEQLRQSQKLEAIGQLAGGIAHDFNNMLTAIGGYADLLALSFDEGDARADDVEQIQKASAHAAALTRQLLSFSRKQVLQPQPLDVNDVVRELEAMLTRTIGGEIELTHSLAPTCRPSRPTRPVRPGRAQHRPERTGRNAGRRHADDHDWPRRPREPHLCLVEIADTGTGMDEETCSRAFEPFFTTKAMGKGTGLGLATAYGVISQSGGRSRSRARPAGLDSSAFCFPRPSSAPRRAAGRRGDAPPRLRTRRPGRRVRRRSRGRRSGSSGGTRAGPARQRPAELPRSGGGSSGAHASTRPRPQRGRSEPRRSRRRERRASAARRRRARAAQASSSASRSSARGP